MMMVQEILFPARILTLTTLTGTILAAVGLMLMAQAPWLLRLAQTTVVH